MIVSHIKINVTVSLVGGSTGGNVRLACRVSLIIIVQYRNVVNLVMERISVDTENKTVVRGHHIMEHQC